MEKEVDIVLDPDPADAVETDDAVVVLQDGAGAEELPKQAVRNPDGSVTLPLLFPVTLRFKKGSSGDVREEQFDELLMHRLTGADMRAITAGSAGTMIVIGIARAARINEGKMSALFDKMDGADANAAAQVVSFFLGSGRPTGR